MGNIIENFDDEDFSVALELKKIKLDDNLYLLMPVNYLEIFEDDLDDQVFEDEITGIKLYKATDASFLYSDEESGYLIVDTYLNIVEKYKGKFQDVEEILEEDIYSKFYRDQSDKFYCAIGSDKGEFKLLSLSKKDLRKINFGKNEIVDPNKNEENEISLVFQQFYLEDLLKAYKNNDKKVLKNFFDIVKVAVNPNEALEKTPAMVSTKKENEKQTQAKKSELKKETVAKQQITVEENKLNPKKIYNAIRRTVIGQDESIKSVVSSLILSDYAKNPTDKKNCMITGPTGTGKTEIMRCLGKAIDRPFVNVATTDITVAGYVGGTPEENIILPLIKEAKGDIKKAERGIILLDEIDKKGSDSNSDVSGRGVLNSLLTFIEGTKIDVQYNYSKVSFDTSKLVIYAGGAFTDLEKYSRTTNLGFHPGGGTHLDISKSIYTTENLIEIGMMPKEFIARFPNITTLNKLSETDLERILIKSNKSPLTFLIKYFKEELGVNIVYEDSFINAIAKAAHLQNNGARSLSKIIEDMIAVCRWRVMTNPNKYKECILTSAMIENPKKFVLK
jgi:ATP-dependent protease Clp, ATPase subunit